MSEDGGFLIANQGLVDFWKGVLDPTKELVPYEDVYVGEQKIATNYVFVDKKVETQKNNEEG